MDREKKIANTEEMFLAMTVTLTIGFLIGYILAMNIEIFANPKLKECIQQTKYQ